MATQSSAVTKYTLYCTATVSGNTVSWSAYIQFNNYYHYGVGLKLYVNGTCVKDVTGYTTSGRQQCCKVSGTTTVAQTHAAQTVQVYASSYSATVSGYGGVGAATTTGKISLSVPAKASYTVAYSANGGSGAPGSQTKWHGETLTLSSAKPSRTGYTFAGWNTSSSGTGTNYSAGGSYTGNAAMTLYAKWTANKYTITLNPNGGSGGTASVTKTYGQAVALPSGSSLPTRTNYKFAGWNTAANGTGANYAAGASYSVAITANTTLYAKWELACLPPRIPKFTVYRADADGNQDISGTCLGIQLETVADTDVKADTLLTNVQVFLGASSTPIASTDTGEVASFSWQANVEAGLDQSMAYSVRVVVSDANGLSTAQTAALPLPFVLLDATKEGLGLGCFAPAKGLSVAMDTRLADGRSVSRAAKGCSWGGGADAALLKTTDPGEMASSSFYPILSARSMGGSWEAGTLGSSNAFRVVHLTDAQRAAGEAPKGRFALYPTSAYHLGAKEDASGYYGFCWGADSSDIGGYLRAPSSGFIPYTSGGSGYLGTSGWPFNYIYGKYIYQNGGQVANKADLTAANNILWTGVYYMSSGQTATLSAAVSAQKNGIVLCWSAYVSGAAQNTDWNYFFVPKWHVAAHAGNGITNFVRTSGGGYQTSKYVYVNNTSITGFASNSGATASNYFVLRAVIGV